ncbi:hypothetical protein Ancab_035973 [Ancistrocladus abbreviatus]
MTSKLHVIDPTVAGAIGYKLAVDLAQSQNGVNWLIEGNCSRLQRDCHCCYLCEWDLTVLLVLLKHEQFEVA